MAVVQPGGLHRRSNKFLAKDVFFVEIQWVDLV